VTLVTPPGGIVLDPFMGSGTIVQATRDLGFTGWGIDREAEYVEDAKRRLRQGSLL
jgi:DNA modification methylase